MGIQRRTPFAAPDGRGDGILNARTFDDVRDQESLPLLPELDPNGDHDGAGAGAAGAGAGAAGLEAAFLRGAAFLAFAFGAAFFMLDFLAPLFFALFFTPLFLAEDFFFLRAGAAFLLLFAFFVFAFAFRFFAIINLPMVSANPKLIPARQRFLLAVPAALCPRSPSRSARRCGQPGLLCPLRFA